MKRLNRTPFLNFFMSKLYIRFRMNLYSNVYDAWRNSVKNVKNRKDNWNTSKLHSSKKGWIALICSHSLAQFWFTKTSGFFPPNFRKRQEEAVPALAFWKVSVANKKDFPLFAHVGPLACFWLKGRNLPEIKFAKFHLHLKRVTSGKENRNWQ